MYKQIIYYPDGIMEWEDPKPPPYEGRTIGCGCCSNSERMTKEEAIKAIDQEIEYWENAKKNVLQSK